ncbi:MAG: glycosyltransferase family 4 protein [Candidatus Methylomirabilales bacterium]
MPTEPLHVAIDFAAPPEGNEGVAAATLCLIHALGQLTDGRETYTVVVPSAPQAARVRPYLGLRQRVGLRRAGGAGAPGAGALLRRTLGTLRPAARAVRRLVNPPRWPAVPVSDGFYEGLGAEVVHFASQGFTLCALPSVYSAHELEHLHFPQCFTPEALAWREALYPTAIRLAHTVVVGSRWTRADLLRRYPVDPAKVQVIPEAPPTLASPEPAPEALRRLARTLGLPRPFALYPAGIWPHKNHLRLLEALALLRDRDGCFVRLVCAGAASPRFWPEVERRVADLGLADRVRFPGFLPEDDLRGVYRLAHALVLPGLFEASSHPVFAAWQEGVPVACARAAALPEQVEDAALLFDGESVEALADAVRRILDDESLRRRLQERAARRLAEVSWERTARMYRAVYRQAAGAPLGEEERALLAGPDPRETQPLREPAR